MSLENKKRDVFSNEDMDINELDETEDIDENENLEDIGELDETETENENLEDIGELDEIVDVIADGIVIFFARAITICQI
jgi:hypothetical protein